MDAQIRDDIKTQWGEMNSSQADCQLREALKERKNFAITEEKTEVQRGSATYSIPHSECGVGSGLLPTVSVLSTPLGEDSKCGAGVLPAQAAEIPGLGVHTHSKTEWHDLLHVCSSSTIISEM